MAFVYGQPTREMQKKWDNEWERESETERNCENLCVCITQQSAYNL